MTDNGSVEQVAPAAPAVPNADPAFRQVLQQSPTLLADMERLQSEGYTIRWGSPGKGTYIVENDDNPHIVIDQNARGDGARIAGALSHEIGHKEFSEPVDRSTRVGYVTGLLRDEAGATVHNARVRREILDNGGPDIGFAGHNARQYEAITDQMLGGKITEAQAIERIAEVYKTERTSNTKETYEDYYGKYYRARAPTLEGPQAQEPAAPPGSPADPSHPDHAMLEQIRAGVRGIDTGIGKSYDDASERMSRCLLPECKNAGLQRVDHVVVGGINVFAVQGGLTDPAHLRAHVSTEQAIRTPVEHSDERLMTVNKGIAEQQVLARQHELVREQDDPNRNGLVMR
jgi:hypothetical protein